MLNKPWIGLSEKISNIYKAGTGLIQVIHSGRALYSRPVNPLEHGGLLQGSLLYLQRTLLAVNRVSAPVLDL